MKTNHTAVRSASRQNGAQHRKANAKGKQNMLASVEEIRRFNVHQILQERFDRHQGNFAQAIGRSPSSISRVLSEPGHPNHKNIGTHFARTIESALGLPRYWLDTDHQRPGGVVAVAATHTNLIGWRQVPLLGSTATGPTMTQQQSTVRAQWITGDAHAYALRVEGNHLSPRARDGEYLCIEPQREPLPSDDVFVTMENGETRVLEYVGEVADRRLFADVIRHERMSIVTKDIRSMHYIAAIIPIRGITQTVRGSQAHPLKHRS